MNPNKIVRKKQAEYEAAQALEPLSCWWRMPRSKSVMQSRGSRCYMYYGSWTVLRELCGSWARLAGGSCLVWGFSRASWNRALRLITERERAHMIKRVCDSWVTVEEKQCTCSKSGTERSERQKSLSKTEMPRRRKKGYSRRLSCCVQFTASSKIKRKTLSLSRWCCVCILNTSRTKPHHTSRSTCWRRFVVK